MEFSEGLQTQIRMAQQEIQQLKAQKHKGFQLFLQLQCNEQ